MGDWYRGWGRPVRNVGQVGLLRTHGFSSWLIRTFTRARTNHVVIDVGDGLISAEYPYVIKRPYDYFSNIIWSRFDLTIPQQQKIASFANEQLGKRYNWADFLAIGVGILTRQHTPRWLMHWLSSNGEWICSSLSDAALRHGGIHLFDDERPVGAVVPASFERWFADAGWLPVKIRFSKRGE